MLDNNVFTCAYYVVLLSSIAGLHWMHACGYDVPNETCALPASLRLSSVS